LSNYLNVLVRAAHQFSREYQNSYTRKNWINRCKRSCVKIDQSVSFTGAKHRFSAIRIGCDAEIARGAELYISSDISNQATITIGERCYIGQYSNLGAYCPITIGNDTMIGPFCHIVSGNHRFDRRDISMSQQGHSVAPVVIDEDVWLGTHVVVLPGVTIGKGAIVAAGAVVNKDIPSYEVWGGVPAKFLKERP